MTKTVFTLAGLAAGISWWFASAPAAHHQPAGPITYAAETAEAVARADRSAAFARALDTPASELPGHDDVVFPASGGRALFSAMDGWIWEYELASHSAQRLVDAPLMAAGLHLSPIDPEALYFCSSRLWGETYPAEERVGLYRLGLSTGRIDAVVLEVPDAAITGRQVWALDDPRAPKLAPDGAAARPLAFCNDLEISADGQRIYFTEPFAHAGAAMGGGTVAEAIAHHGNGRIWMHDLGSGETRIIAEGFFFPDGILYDIHPDTAQETSLISSLTPGFEIVRLFVSGPKAGRWESVQAGLPGMCDGIDRDADGRIWCGVLAPRSGLITWIHAHPWIKRILLRLPLNWMSPPRKTGVIAFSPDASAVLYSAWYEGRALTHIASAVPAPQGAIYLTPFDRAHRGIVRLPNPLLPSEDIRTR